MGEVGEEMEKEEVGGGFSSSSSIVKEGTAVKPDFGLGEGIFGVRKVFGGEGEGAGFAFFG